ncbi:hypothetical protein [Gulosibacter sp. 10]|uniref:hypothetical protein n=1 Tax=Gulosibacter sp. 10 TaxID=1255570 RepID=UPI00097ED036|nr:hypothetical protein [Gulosibacter sp. 10]SJM69317.1 hypothetical protein FM112_14065 [Gulosibacter sp. 10]
MTFNPAALEVATQILLVLVLATLFDPDRRGALSTRPVYAEGYGSVRVPAKHPFPRYKAWVDFGANAFAIVVVAFNFIALINLRDDGSGDPAFSDAFGLIVTFANCLAIGAIAYSVLQSGYLFLRRSIDTEPDEEPDSDGGHHRPDF